MFTEAEDVPFEFFGGRQSEKLKGQGADGLRRRVALLNSLKI
jgi:hypothetical protein